MFTEKISCIGLTYVSAFKLEILLLQDIWEPSLVCVFSEKLVTETIMVPESRNVSYYDRAHYQPYG